MAQDLGVKFIACQMTMDVMGLTKADFVEDIEVGGAVTFLGICKRCVTNINILTN